MKKRKFEVVGELEVSRTNSKKGVKSIEKVNVKEFWIDNPEVKKKRGIYIFATRAGKGFTPYYVGKTDGNFGGEIFQPQKLNKYNHTLINTNGKPVFFFIVQGHKNANINKKVETFLTALCYKKNPNIQNIQNVKEDKWYISGVINHKNFQGKRRPKKSESKLKKCIGV